MKPLSPSLVNRDSEQRSPLPFTPEPAGRERSSPMRCSPSAALEAINNVSRRIKDLARQLNCLGFFDDEDNRPRAA